MVEQFGDLVKTEIIAKAEPRIRGLIKIRETLTDEKIIQTNADEQNKLSQVAKTKFLAYLTIKSLDDLYYGELKQSLYNQYNTGNRSVYPSTIEEAIHMANQFWKNK